MHMKTQKPILSALLVLMLASACGQAVTPTIEADPPTQTVTLPTAATQPSPVPTRTLTLPGAPTSTPTATPLPSELALDPDEWKSWPVQPILTSQIAEIYARGQELGNDPNAFSIFGDCQSKPEVFMGVYETDPDVIAALPAQLQETVANFTGSFNRESPTVKDATTVAGLLNPIWHEGKYTCTLDESPVECELRIHNPSFVFINTGTHWITRNQEYLETIIQQLLEAGVVPILATKADDRYQGEKTNQALANMAAKYGLPLWNYWAAALVLPEHGLYTKEGQGGLGDVYLTDQAILIYRLSALQALDSVWRAATGQ